MAMASPKFNQIDLIEPAEIQKQEKTNTYCKQEAFWNFTTCEWLYFFRLYKNHVAPSDC